jgi:DNA polymerase I
MHYILDLECDNLLDKVTKIHCVVLKDINTNEVFSDLEIIKKKLIDAKLVIGHNIIAFDTPVLKKILNIDITAEQFDTLVACRLIWAHIQELDYKRIHQGFPARLLGRQTLESWGHRLQCYKGQKPLDWETYTPEMLEYCKQDVEVTHKLYNKIIEKNYSQVALDLEHSVQKICVQMMHNGIGFDTKQAQILYSILSNERTELENKLKEIFKPWEEYTTIIPKRDNKTLGYIKDKPFKKIKIIEFNPNSRDHISFRLKVLRNWQPSEFTPDGKAKIDDEILSTLDWPEAKILSRYFLVQKRISQLSEGKNGWLKLENDNRIYGSINTNGAVTGRCTHAAPNLAQVPAVIIEYGKECRELFCAPENKILVGADMSQIELRMLGHYMFPYDDGEYANDVSNGDIHTRTLQALDLTQEQRWLAKRFMYTFLYGGGGKKLGEVMGVTASEGYKLRDKFLKRIPALKKLVDKVQEASLKGDIKGLDGRRVFVRSQHSALNSLLQSSAAICSKVWIQECKSFLSDKIKLVAWIHDEIILEVEKDKAEFAKVEAVKAIQRIQNKLNLRVPLTGESKIGKNWKEIH